MVSIKRSSLILWLAMIMLAFYKLWLVEGLTVSAQTLLTADDAHFINLARQLLDGIWLGPYSATTLIKGPLYPIWIATVFKLGIPLLVSQQLFYIISCLVFVIALQPQLSNRIFQLLIFATLLFNPITFTHGAATRVVREGIYPALTLLVIASALAILFRREKAWRVLLFWAIGLGFALSGFWLTREEGVWLMPALGLIIAAGLIDIWRVRPSDWKWKLGIWVLPLVIWLTTTIVVSGLNQAYYGVFAKTEFDSTAFKAAYGAMIRVKPEIWKPKTYLPKQVREELYDVSPTFAELEPHLEGVVGKNWSASAKGREIELTGDRILWAFRHAVTLEDYYSEGKFPKGFYQRMADEINTACSDKRLECYAPHHSLMPIIQLEHLRPLLVKMFQAGKYIVGFQGLVADSWASVGPEEAGVIFTDLTREDLSEFRETIVLEGWAFKDHEQISFLIVDNKGGTVEANIKRQPSPDVYQFFLEQGEDIPNAGQARYRISFYCPGKCFLEIWSGDELLGHYSVAQFESLVAFNKNDFHLYIEKGDLSPAFIYQTRSNQTKIKVLKKTGMLYQIFSPFAVTLGLLGFIYLTIRFFLGKWSWIYWIANTALLVGVVCRIFILSLIDITSFPAIHTLYFSPAYPLMLSWITLTLIWAFEDLRIAYLDHRKDQAAGDKNLGIMST